MATKKKLLQAAAGQAGGAGGLNVEEVFSTYLYEGDVDNNQIQNGIDLAGEGGMVWLKSRSAGFNHCLFDTERGVLKRLRTDGTNAEQTNSGSLSVFNSDGFTLGNTSVDWNGAYDYVSWTFRKAPKFFDVVTYTGNGTAGRTISHNLGGEVGCMIIKKTSSSTDANWAVYHRKTVTPDPAEFSTFLNLTAAAFRQGQHFNDTEPTSTEFTLGNSTTTNKSGEEYVAYLFAHNDGDGEFGPTGDQDIIKCGSYTGTGSDGNSISLGFEPQWVLVKKTNEAYDWTIFDNMRGVVNGGNDQFLHPNLSDAEDSPTNAIHFDADGFTVNGGFAWTNDINDTYIYIAIRRGPMAVPESATDVFDVGDASETGSTAPEYEGGFTVDMALKRIQSASQSNYVFDRLRGGQSLITNGTSAESAFGAAKFDYMDGYYNGTSTSSANWSAMWRRAPNYFDVVAGTGTSTLDAVPHNLGVTPELIIQKKRSGSSSMDWFVTGSGVGGTNKYLILNSTAAVATTVTLAHDASTFTPIFDQNDYIAYLFATLDGISKVGSYTGSASAQTIDCGFTAGARFVLIKRTDSTGSWVVWDTNRGIVAGNDPYFKLETNAAPTTTDDIIDPHNSGFTLAGGVGFINTSGGSYIFYAIA